MILEGRGSLLDSDAEMLVNPVNTFGVMGAGLALQFRNKYPNVFTAYRIACQRGDVRIGEMFVVDRIIHFPTKEHWKASSRLEYVEKGLTSLVAMVRARGVRTIAVPALGCGLGGLPWPTVRAQIVNAFMDVDTTVFLFEPKQ